MHRDAKNDHPQQSAKGLATRTFCRSALTAAAMTVPPTNVYFEHNSADATQGKQHSGHVARRRNPKHSAYTKRLML